MAARPEPSDPFTGLLRAVAAERVQDAAAARSRTRWLVRQAEEEGTLTGVLADLAERAEPVICTTTAGRRHVGVVQVLGADFVALRIGNGTTTLVARGALAQVQTQPGTATVAGDRALRLEQRLVEVLAELVGDRPDVVVGTGNAELRGELRAVGRDMVTLRVSGQRAGAAYVALACAQEVRVG